MFHRRTRKYFQKNQIKTLRTIKLFVGSLLLETGKYIGREYQDRNEKREKREKQPTGYDPVR